MASEPENETHATCDACGRYAEKDTVAMWPTGVQLVSGQDERQWLCQDHEACAARARARTPEARITEMDEDLEALCSALVEVIDVLQNGRGPSDPVHRRLSDLSNTVDGLRKGAARRVAGDD